MYVLYFRDFIYFSPSLVLAVYAEGGAADTMTLTAQTLLS